jgi:HAD domain in Swiss Army Knife RNA repair proteins
MDKELNVLFLDIDGVLLPFGDEGLGYQEEPFHNGIFPDRTLRALSNIFQYSAVPLLLVLSSTWRVRNEYRQTILQAFHNYNCQTGQNFLPTEFYDVTNVNMHTERQWEIFDWLMNQRGGQSIRAWICLDDEDLLEEHQNHKYRHIFQHHVVKTISSIGLTNKDTALAVRLLKRQLNKTEVTCRKWLIEID